MAQSSPSSDAALLAVCRLAQRDADRMHGPAVPRPPAAARRGWRTSLAAALAVGAAFAGWDFAGSERAVPIASHKPASGAWGATPFGDAMPTTAPRATPTSVPAATDRASGAPQGAASVRVVDGAIDIDVVATPLGDVARMLAAATRSPMRAAGVGRPGARPVTIKWRGRDANEAWRVLMAAALSYAATCRGLTCEVWVLGEVPSAAAPAASSPPVRRPDTVPVAAVDPQVAEEVAAFGEPQ